MGVAICRDQHPITLQPYVVPLPPIPQSPRFPLFPPPIHPHPCNRPTRALLSCAAVCALDWSRPQVMQTWAAEKSSTFDIIIGADITYYLDTLDDLVLGLGLG